ncbi:MAG: hypothetical protein IPI65_12090 [Bacteroidetes bacterium]|nr:hypothetical protein [Bacteroidota bacterium]
MKNVFVLATAIIFTLTIQSCKDDTVEPVVYEVTFTILEPEDGAVFTSGDELHMEVDFEGTKPLGNVEMFAINHLTDDTLAYFTAATSETFFMMHEHVDLSVTEITECHFIVSAWETNYADRKTEEIDFTINP